MQNVQWYTQETPSDKLMYITIEQYSYLPWKRSVHGKPVEVPSNKLQVSLSDVGFWSWILVNFTTYGAWPPVTYLTGPPQAFRGQCINMSYFIAAMILLSNTYRAQETPSTSFVYFGARKMA